MKLTEEQYQAVHNTGGHLLVSAAAGSGKTKVLIDRLMTQLTDSVSPADIRDFLIITFTQAAASELRGKIENRMQELLAEDPENRRLTSQLELLPLAQISTIHAFCSSLLRDYSTYLKLPQDFSIANDTELRRIREKVFEDTLNTYQPKNEKLYTVFCDYATDGKGYGKLYSEIEALEQVCIGRPDRDAWLDSLQAGTFNDCDDYATTAKGSVLFQECRSILLDFKAALQNTVTEIDAIADPSGKYTAVLQENISEICTYLNCRSWDELSAKGSLKLTALFRGKTNLDLEQKENIKKLRSWFKDRFNASMEPLAASSLECVKEEAETSAYISFLIDLYREFAYRFREEKLRLHLLDFNDLEHETLRLLYGRNYPEPSSTARRISRRYREIMIDEYQDTSLTQEAILQALTTPGTTSTLFAVGDIKQSIYRFRLAAPEIFLEKYNSWKPATHAKRSEPRKICLNRNFRSDSEIIHAVNAVCSRCMSPEVGGLYYTDTESLISGTDNSSPFSSPVELHLIDGDLNAEANFTAKRVFELLNEEFVVNGERKHLAPGDIAILLRSPKNAAEVFSDALERVGIPTYSDSGSDIFKSEELTFLASMLEIIDNPRRDIPLTGVLSSRFYRVSLNTLLSIRSRKDNCLYDAVLHQNTESFSRFVSLREQLSATAYRDGVSAMFEELLSETHAIPVFRKLSGGTRRIKNIFALRSIVYEHEATGGNLSTLISLLRCHQKWGRNEAEIDRPNAVRITSVHKSKGLEYPVVILPCLSKGFNQEDLRNKFLFHGTLGAACDVIDSSRGVVHPGAAKKALGKILGREALSEEMRILYVALTRAKHKLIFSYCDKNIDSAVTALTQKGAFCGINTARYATCPGDWVLLEALQRPEAAFLRGECSSAQDYPSDRWNILRHSTQDAIANPDSLLRFDAGAGSLTDAAPDLNALAASFNFRYPFEAAINLPARITATEFSHELRASPEGSSNKQERAFSFGRKVIRSGAASLSAAEIGTALHTAMQFVHFPVCRNAEGVQAEIQRLIEEEYLTSQQADTISADVIADFFQSETGRRILSADKLLREFHFSILANSGEYYPGTNEPIMVQGIADCCIFEGSTFSVIDFKTDRVSPNQAAAYSKRYHAQLDTYARALSTIFELPCKDKLLYFMSAGVCIKVP